MEAYRFYEDPREQLRARRSPTSPRWTTTTCRAGDLPAASSRRPRARLTIPVIASLNGTSRGGWTRYARMIQDAGADALELNVYFVATDPDQTAADVEARYIDLVQAVRASIAIPLAVKIGPFFSSPAQHGRAADRDRGRRPGPLQPLPPAGHRPGDPDGDSPARAEHQRRASAAAALDRHPPRHDSANLWRRPRGSIPPKTCSRCSWPAPT